ncbi:MAG: DUF4125 family protein [Clostridia bacterium]|nr:DUF4125 family protein [Clostridia bacterium]
MSLIDEILTLEWEQFSAVANEDGQAPCQQDPAAFDIMRRSQFMTWPEQLLKSYWQDLVCAKKAERNLMTEKYARMMESTAPESYASLADMLPMLSESHQRLVESIIPLQIRWMEIYVEQYPRLALGNRRIYTSEDGPYETSYETYLRGELSIYSDATLRIYQAFVQELLDDGRNLMLEVMENTVRFYGFSSLEHAESSQQ